MQCCSDEEQLGNTTITWAGFTLSSTIAGITPCSKRQLV
jgi:hypothetical protein